jgi:hypothetical protein
MRGRPVALRGGRNSIGILLQVFDQLAQVRRLDIVRIDDQRVRHLGHDNDRLEFGRIEPQLRIEALVDHERRRRRREQCVAVGRCAKGRLGTNVSGGPSAVVNHHRLAPFSRQPVRDQPRHRISRASSRERHDDFYSAVGIAIRPCRALKAIRCEAKRQGDCRSACEKPTLLDHAAHVSSLPTICSA